MAMAKAKPKVGTEPFTFPKPVLEGLGFNFSVVLFSFSIPLKISVFCRDCRNLVCPCGWGRHGFPYEFQLQTWRRSSEPWEQGSSGGWSCSPPMEGLGRKRLPTHLGSPGLSTTLLAGSSIPHRLLTLFPQSHTWSHCRNSVSLCVLCVLVPSTLSLVLHFPLQPVGARPRLPSTGG